MNVKEIGLRKPVKKDRKFSCTFDDKCEEFFPTQGELNKHLQSVHKATFKCPKCERTYDMANGLNKHYKKHFKFTNICSECGKGFQFPKQLTIHERKHTNSQAGKFVCPTGGCNKVLLSKEGLKAHQQIHEGLKFECDICGKKDFDTVLCLKQHKLGKHGNGTIAFCGKKFQWPDTKYRHQGICDSCKEIKRKMDGKPDLPNPIFRCLKKKLFTVISAENRLNELFCKYSILFYGTFL